MSKKKKEPNIIPIVEKMIKEADKGPSGFWVDDGCGCGNPRMFPEFENALKKCDYFSLPRDICPWNTAVMYGPGHGNIPTGCCYSCSIADAKKLPASMIKDILKRFLTNYKSGNYKEKDHIEQLLTKEEICCIEKAKEQEAMEYEKEKEERLKVASELIKKYPDDERLKELLSVCYGTTAIVNTSYGLIDFDPNRIKDIVGAKTLTYNEYLDIMLNSASKTRKYFETVFYESCLNSFKGRVESIQEKRICFERIYVSGVYNDGICFEGKEDHVWMDISGFEKCKVGSCVSFSAEAYRYLWTGNGKSIDYGLRNPSSIKHISPYEIPTDEMLLLQEIDNLVCEQLCLFRDHCDRGPCIADPKWRDQMKNNLLEMAKNQPENQKKM